MIALAVVGSCYPLMPSHSELTKVVSLQPFTLVFSIMQMLRESPVFLKATNLAKASQKPEMGLGTIFGIFRYLSSKPISSWVYSPLCQSSVCRHHIWSHAPVGWYFRLSNPRSCHFAHQGFHPAILPPISIIEGFQNRNLPCPVRCMRLLSLRGLHMAFHVPTD